MKYFIAYCLIALFVACDSSEKKNAEVSSEKKESNEATKQEKSNVNKDDFSLQQHGDYSALFNRDPKDCSFISSEIIAASLQVKNEMITQGSNTCNYHLITENGENTRFYFTVEQWGNKQILKEISSAKDNAEAFGKDSKLSQYRISETGDTYLSMHQNRMIRILNEANDVAIILFYFVEIAPDENDIQKKNKLKDEARERSYAIANFLIKKYQTK